MGRTGLCLLALVVLASSGTAQAQDKAKVEVTESVISTSVVDRNPQGIANEFPAGVGRLYCFTRVVGMVTGEVMHRWSREGKTELEVRLKVGGLSWRVWSAKTIYPGSAGAWKVEVIDTADGSVLKTLEFRITP